MRAMLFQSLPLQVLNARPSKISQSSPILYIFTDISKLIALIARNASKRRAGAAFGAGNLSQNHYPHHCPHCPQTLTFCKVIHSACKIMFDIRSKCDILLVQHNHLQCIPREISNDQITSKAIG
jgi:hypothetical protein